MFNLNNVTIKSRLIFVIAFLSLQLIVGGAIGIGSLHLANSSMKTIYDDRLVALGQLDQVVRLLDLNQMRIAKALSLEPSEALLLMKEVDLSTQKMEAVWDEYMATQLTADERRFAEQFVVDRNAFQGKGIAPAVAAIRTGQPGLATDILEGPIAQLYPPVYEGMNALISLQLDVAKKEFERSQSTYELVRISCTIGLLFGVLLAAVIGVWLLRSISRPLDTAVKVAERVAAGDLSQQIEVQSRDETGKLMQALKTMNDSLRGMVAEVRNGTDAIATASGQIAAGNQDLSARTEQQASSLEETASSMEQLTSTVQQNIDNARQANQLAAAASDVAVRGGQVVGQVVDTMQEINTSAKRIADIIGVIDGIAFQTNILALNAAVEAARAGEQGRGFAVVATEVRNLAQRSAAAAREIKALIGDSVTKVGNGASLVAQAGTTMDEVVASVRRVTDIMADITAASQEQGAGIGQVNQAITQMDRVTQQNAALVEEAAAAAASMQDQAASLALRVDVFKLGNDVRKSREALPKAAPAVLQKPARQLSTATATAPPRHIPKRRTPAMAGDDDWQEF